MTVLFDTDTRAASLLRDLERGVSLQAQHIEWLRESGYIIRCQCSIVITRAGLAAMGVSA